MSVFPFEAGAPTAWKLFWRQVSYNVGLHPAAKWSKTKSVGVFFIWSFPHQHSSFQGCGEFKLIPACTGEGTFWVLFYRLFHIPWGTHLSLLPDLHVIRMWEIRHTNTLICSEARRQPTELLEHLCWKLTKHQGSGKRKAVLNSNLFPTDKPKLRLQGKTLSPPPVASSVSSHSSPMDETETRSRLHGANTVWACCAESLKQRGVKGGGQL